MGMNTPSILVGALVCSVIGGVVAGYVDSKIESPGFTANDSRYVYTFAKDQLVTPEKPEAFKEALGDDKVTFRRRVGIYDEAGNCDQAGLEDTGLECPEPCESGTKMGAQVTQRVGFNSRKDLDAALALLNKDSSGLVK